MRAMQYTIKLPSDFSAEKIRERVNVRSQLFDTLDGLAHKSFLFNPEDHIYAPFYIWQSPEASRSFLLNDLFKGVIETFNRPRVRTWSVLSATYGNKSMQPCFAIREADLIPADANLSALAMKEIEKQAGFLKKNPNVYYHVVALDSDRWEIIRYSLWLDNSGVDAIDMDCAQTYEVLHVSEPNI